MEFEVHPHILWVYYLPRLTLPSKVDGSSHVFGVGWGWPNIPYSIEAINPFRDHVILNVCIYAYIRSTEPLCKTPMDYQGLFYRVQEVLSKISGAPTAEIRRSTNATESEDSSDEGLPQGS